MITSTVVWVVMLWIFPYIFLCFGLARTKNGAMVLIFFGMMSWVLVLSYCINALKALG